MSTFPEDLIPQSITVRESRPANMTVARSGYAQRVYRGSHFFEFEITWPPLNERNHRRLMAFVAGQDGIVAPFEMVIPATEALGTAAGTPVVQNAHLAGDTTLKTRGWYLRSRVMAEGDLFRLGQKIYRVTERARANASGEVTLNINPGLRQDASDGEGLTVRGLSFRVFFLSDSVETQMIRSGEGVLYVTAAAVREDWI